MARLTAEASPEHQSLPQSIRGPERRSLIPERDDRRAVLACRMCPWAQRPGRVVARAIAQECGQLDPFAFLAKIYLDVKLNAIYLDIKINGESNVPTS